MHSFQQEFPEKASLIRSFKLKDRHFARLLEEYNELDEQITQAEQRTTSHLEDLKIRRLYLKDRLQAMLADD